MSEEVRSSRAGLSITRRELVVGGLAGGIAAAAGATAGAQTESSAPEPRAARAIPQFQYEEASVRDLQKAMEEGGQTARSLAELYLDRIERVDRSGPALNAVIEVNPEALAIAEALDAERKAKGPRGPLHGIPVLIKDNIATADRMETTAGSLALVGAKPGEDAHVVERLRAAGAVILGKTNLSEWANFRSTRSTSGWSGRGGQTLNPYSRDRSPSGSSSGTGAGIAANLAAIGVGTETDGSILSPSSVQALVGIKPTVGLVSRAGIIPIAASQDTAGPMCRSVADAAVLLGALAGADERDPATAASKGKIADYTQGFDAKGLAGARLGVARGQGFGRNPAVDAAIEAALEEMRRLGATIVDPADLAWGKEIDDAEYEVLLYEFKDGIAKYLASLGPNAPARDLKGLIDWNEKNRDREMPWFDQEIFHAAEAKGPLTDAAYKKARATCVEGARKKGIDATLAKHKLDAIVTPTNGFAWLIDWIDGDSYTGGSTSPAAVAGYPSITVPAGIAFGLPIGISFTGPAWSEAKLIRLAYAYELGTKVRRPPGFHPSADIATDRMPAPPAPKKPA